MVKSAEAKYRQEQLANQAAGEMPESMIRLELARMEVEKVAALGNASWAYPSVMQGVVDKIMPNMRFHNGKSGTADLN